VSTHLADEGLQTAGIQKATYLKGGLAHGRPAGFRRTLPGGGRADPELPRLKALQDRTDGRQALLQQGQSPITAALLRLQGKAETQLPDGQLTLGTPACFQEGSLTAELDLSLGWIREGRNQEQESTACTPQNGTRGGVVPG